MREENLILESGWDKVFPKSDKVNHRKVTFHNRYGITLVADLYEPISHDGKLSAIAICGPFGAVKEQSSGLYAQILAEKGYLTIAFDPSFTGESGGYPRNVASPDIMLMYGKEASNRKQEIDRQHYTIPNQRPKDKHCGKI